MGDSDDEAPLPPEVPPILRPEDLPPEVFLVAGRTPRRLWRPLLHVLEEFRVQRRHGRIYVRLVESYGTAKDAEVTYEGIALKCGGFPKR